MDMRPKKKKIRAKRELRGDWPDEKIRELIYNVESRPELWDIGNASYHDHHISRTQSWQELASELGQGYDWCDCRLKWQNLRVTYRSNIHKISKNKSGLETDEAPRIQWRFFEAMRFIDKKDQRQHATGTDFRDFDEKLTLKLEKEMSSALSSTLASQQNWDSSQCSSSFIKQESCSPVNIRSTPPPYLASTSIQKEVSTQETKLKYKNDEHACFGNYIASELRSLPPEQSFALKRRLNRTLLDFWDDMQAQVPTVSIPITENFRFRNDM